MSGLNGRTLGRYQLKEPLGAGGMGEVYRAHDTRLDRDVAIKVLSASRLASDEARTRLRREADILSKLNHPNIATVFDFDSEDGIDFVVMELVAGETLAAQAARGPLDERETLRVGAAIAAALAEAHELGVIHRDLKPGNVMVTPKGQVKLLDFGLAHRPVGLEISAEATLTVSGAVTGNLVGTYPYMAPEQLRNEQLGPWTDTWALGALLYEISTSRRAFGGDNLVTVIDDILNHEPPQPSSFNASLSPAFDQIIQKALCKSPGGRFRTASEFAGALEVLRGGYSGGPTSQFASRIIPVQPELTRRRRGRIAAASVAALAVIAIAIVGAVRLLRGGPAATPAATVSVLIGGVDNRTGDPTFDQMLPELLATTLEQSKTVEVYPPSNLPYVLRRMQRDPGTRIDETIGREICQREGLSAVIVQSITKLGSSFVLVMRAVLPDGRLLAATQETMSDPSELPRRIDEASKTLRRSVGESAASIARASTPLEQVTSKSLDAVRFYTMGHQRIFEGDARGAIELLQKAIEADPEFAMAHEGLGVSYQNLFDNERAAQHFREAAARVSRLPDTEREKILGDFNMIRRNYDGACPHYEALSALRPRDPATFLMLGLCSARRLDFPTAISATTKASEMQPSPKTRLNLALVSLLSGDTERARAMAEALDAEMPPNGQLGYVEGKALIALGRPEQARAVYARMTNAGADAEIEGHSGLADLARGEGRRDEARRALEAERAAALRHDNTYSAAIASADLAELAAEDGSVAAVRSALAQTPAASTDIQVLYRIGRAWARARQMAEASAILARMDVVAPEHSRQFDAFKAMLRAEIALATPDAAQAIKEAEAAVGFHPSGTALDTLGRAYIAAARPGDAVRPFEQLLRRPGERCDSDDAPACYRLSDVRAWLAARR
jgi:tetratricopeptide (TPR) repeat protein/predicted Ser/Thr protein kinase